MNKVGTIRYKLERWFRNADKIAVVGVGNELRRDDFVGVEVVRNLRGEVSSCVMLIESETIPESFIEPIAKFKPSHVLIIDAGSIGLEPGDIKFFESSGFLSPTGSAISTHAMPLKIFCEYLEKIIGSKVGLVIVQPERTDFGEGLTEAVKMTAKALGRTLLEVVS